MGAGKTGNGRSAREVCGSVRVGRKNLKSVWWNDEIKAAARRKEAARKEVLAASDEEAKERCMEAYREERRKVKRCIYQNKKKVNEQFRWKMNEDVNGNKKLFWKKVSCSTIKDGYGRLAHGEDEVRNIWKDYFEDLYNIDTQE